MKRKLGFIGTLFLALNSLFFVVGCSSSTEIKGIHMSNPATISVPYGNFSYEGINVTVDFANGSEKEIPLEESMISEVERLKFFKMGNQDVEVNYRKKFFTTMPIDVVLNKFKDTYVLNGYECVFDGLPHYVTLNQELPEGATINYPYGNMFINAGSYEIVGVMSKDGYESKTLTTTLTIHKADRDADGIVFEDSTVIYNGEMKTIEATGVPSEVEVSYDIYDYEQSIRINKAVNAGKYRIVAHFNDTSSNFNKIDDKEAILIIEKADYDLSTIEFNDAIKEYDGLNYSASIENAKDLPMGIKPNYSYLDSDGNKVTSNAAAGTYTMVVDFVGGDFNNYNPIPSMTATLTVSKKVIKISDKITFESKIVNFDENTIQSLEISGTIPNGVEITYENNQQIYAGEYEVTAKFTALSPNETVDVQEMKAYLIINKVRRSVLVYNDVTEKYDKEFSEENITINGNDIIVSGFDETVFKVSSKNIYGAEDSEPISIDKLVNGKTYKYVIVFEYLDEKMNGSVILAEESDNFTYIEA